MKFLLTASCSVMLIATVGQLSAETIVWTNTVSGTYSTTDNWNPNQAPEAGDLAELRANAPYTITLDRPATNYSLHVYDGQPTLDLAGFDYSLTNSIFLKNKEIGFYVEKGYLLITNSAATPAVFGSNDTVYASLYQPWNAPVGTVEFTGPNTIGRLQQIQVNDATADNTQKHKLRITGGAKVTTSAGKTLGTGGDILISDPGTTLTASGMFLSGGGITIVSNQATVNIFGNGNIEIGRPKSGYFIITGAGTVCSAGNVVLATADTATYGSLIVTNGGTLTVTNSTASKLWGPNTSDRECDMVVSGVGSVVTTLDMYLSGSSQTATFLNAPFRQTISDSAEIRVKRYTTIWTNGLVHLDNGTLFNSTQGVVNRGHLEGRGRLEREADSGTVTWYNYGTIQPGLTNWVFGTLAFTNCNLTLHPSSRLVFDLGTPAIESHSRIVVQGTTALNGTCAVRLAPSYQPVHGDTFHVITSDTFSGAFSAYDLPDIMPKNWDTSQLATTGVLKVFGPPKLTVITVR